jgi:hypothetical protein
MKTKRHNPWAHLTGNKLGIDVGRVLITPDDAGTADTSFLGGSLEDAMRTPAFEGMFEHLPAMVARFDGQACLVSKAGPRVQEKTRLWLRHHDFHARTGVPQQEVYFCRERREKAAICERLRVTHFIDDRADVLIHLQHVVAHRYLFGPQRPGTVVPSGVTPVGDWAAAQAALWRDLAR